MSTRANTAPRVVCAHADWSRLAAQLPPIESISARGTGQIVTNHRSSWVRRMPAETGDVFAKTYEYRSWRDRVGNWGKWTAPWRRSRPRREWQALAWLHAQGFATPTALACIEWRCCGWLERATLVTTAWPGRPADQVLAGADPADRRTLVAAIRAFVTRLHERGFRDRNLDLRNLLVGGDPSAPVIAKIDSPRYRLVQPERTEDGLARADWQRLLPQLARFE